MSTLALSASIAPDWIERLDRAVEAIQESARSIRIAVAREKAVVKFYVAIRRLNAAISEMHSALDEGVRSLQVGESNFSNPGDEVDAKGIIEKMELCYRIINGIFVVATFAGMKRKTLTKAETIKLGESAEHLLDYIAWLKEGTSEEMRAHAESSFDAGMQEFEAGETVSFL